MPWLILLTLFGLSRPVADAVETLDGKRVELKAPSKGVLAVVFYSAECPISNGQSPYIIEIVKKNAPNRVRVVGVAVDYDHSREELLQHATDHQLNYPCTVDPKGKLCRQFGATATPEAVLIDDKGEVRYRGRINDLYSARGKQNANPLSHDLRNAIDLILSNKPVPKPWPSAVGCPIPDFPSK